LREGRQAIPGDLNDLEYGASVTDACINWADTQTSLRELADAVREALPQRA
jgi:3-deoxy-7-phosphoheptulonate synthase